jgi:hypothetical protein
MPWIRITEPGGLPKILEEENIEQFYDTSDIVF